MLVEVVQDRVWTRFALELDDDPHAVAVGLVGEVGDPLQLPVGDQLGDLGNQVGLVDRVGELFDDDPLAAVGRLFEAVPGADHDPAVSGRIGGLDAVGAHDDAAGWKIRTFDEAGQVFRSCVRVVDQVVHARGDLPEVVGRDVGGHADRDPGRAVDQEVGDPGRQHAGLGFGGVVVVHEVDRVLVDVGEHLVRDPGQPRLRVAHGCGRIAVDGAEVALPVDQRVTQRERLRHPDHGVVYRTLAVRVVELHDLADEGGALLVAGCRRRTLAEHRIKDSALDRLQAVAHVRESARDDDRHRVLHVGGLHLLQELLGQDGSDVVLFHVLHSYSSKRLKTAVAF